MRRLVIVGAGLAGQRAATALRAAGHDGPITVVGDEPHRPYDRPPLSKKVLAGATPAEDCFLGEPDGLDVEWRLGVAAEALDPVGRTVVLADGETVPYAGLVLATGRRARTLPAAAGQPGVHVLRSIDDARRLGAGLRTARSIAIVGAGFVGCEVAATARSLGVEATVVDVSPHPLPVLGPQLGARVAQLHRRHGVALHLGTEVGAFTDTGLLLADGTAVDADLVLVAVGSVPNTEWLQSSGLERHRGAIVCDVHGLVPGRPEIAVAGDVAAWPHPAAGDAAPVSIEHWSNAQRMGALAATNLVADPPGREAHTAVPTFWSDQYEHKLQSAGFVGLADRIEIVDEDPDAEKPWVVAEAFRGDELVGAIAIDRPRALIAYQRRLRATADV